MSTEEKQHTAEQIEMISAARTFIERLRARAESCSQVDGLPILTRGFDYAAKVLEEDLGNQIRALRDEALSGPVVRR